MLTNDPDLALSAALAAAEVAARLQTTVTRTDKADGSPVTEGDLAADAAIRAVLAAHRPDDGILSEEVTDDTARCAKRRVWIIDPIDGTKEYLAGRDGWAVQIALAIDGKLVLGVLAMPRLGATVLGIVGQGAWRIDGDQRIPISCINQHRDTLIASSSKRNRSGLTRIQSALPGWPTVITFSIGVKVWRMLCGDADVYAATRPLAEWDTAAPAALLIAAGGQATELSGAPLRFNAAEPRCSGVVFSTRSDHAALVERLRVGGVEFEP